MTTTLLDERLTDADEAAIALAIEMERAAKSERDRVHAVQPDAGGSRNVRGRTMSGSQLEPEAVGMPAVPDADVDEPSDDWGCRPGEVALLKRMLRAGVSRFHPDPMAAIEAAEQAESRR